MIMVPIKEALTFDDVTLVPKYSEILLQIKMMILKIYYR